MKSRIGAMLIMAIISGQMLGETITIDGWVSDAGCARGRANSGVYSGTNPACARRCIAKGGQSVLIVPRERSIYAVMNPHSVEAYIGDFVEVVATKGDAAGDLHVQSVKLLQKGQIACDRPKR